ncbi:MAG: rhodanese-like domain-containing protein [Akkermansia sp.]
MKEILIQIAKLSIWVVLVAAVVTLVDSKWLSPGRILPCDPNHLESGHICLSTVKAQWQNRIVWVDARIQDAFERGTIKGNVVPLRNDSLAQELLAKAMPVLHQAGFEQKCIIVFCDRNCHSSTEIANKLRSFQLKAPIYVLEGGWDEIRKDPTLAP